MIAIKVGYEFALFDESEIGITTIEKTSSIVEVKNKQYTLYKGASYEDSLTIEGMFDNRKAYNIRENIVNPKYNSDRKLDKGQILERYRLFVDMDGTLAEFQSVDTLETLYERGYFANLQPINSVIEAIKKINDEEPNIEVFILSAVLSDSEFALKEKNEWLDKYIPQIDNSHRIFTECGKCKNDYIQGGVSNKDFLLDDYTMNLNEWEPPAVGIKLLNGINGTKGTWTKKKVSYDKESSVLSEDICNIIKGNRIDLTITDKKR